MSGLIRCTFCRQANIQPGDPDDAAGDRHGRTNSTERICAECGSLVHLRAQELIRINIEVGCDCEACTAIADLPDEDIPADWDAAEHWTERAREAAGTEGRMVLDALGAAIEACHWDSEIEVLCDLLDLREAWYLACAEWEQRESP